MRRLYLLFSRRSRSLYQAFPEAAGVIGLACSPSVFTGVEWLQQNSKDAVVVSPWSTHPDLADDAKCVSLKRTSFW